MALGWAVPSAAHIWGSAYQEAGWNNIQRAGHTNVASSGQSRRLFSVGGNCHGSGDPGIIWKNPAPKQERGAELHPLQPRRPDQQSTEPSGLLHPSSSTFHLSAYLVRLSCRRVIGTKTQSKGHRPWGCRVMGFPPVFTKQTPGPRLGSVAAHLPCIHESIYTLIHICACSVHAQACPTHDMLL